MSKFNPLRVFLIPLLTIITMLATLLPQFSLVARAAGPDSEGDIQLSPTGASLPAIAANGTFEAIVFSRGGQVYLRATKGSTGWWSSPLPVGIGIAPQLAFKPGTSDKLQVVWTSPTGDKVLHRLFTLTETSATGGTEHTVMSGSNLTTPDVAAGTSNRVHVVWATGSGAIQSRLSPDDGGSWSAVATLPVSGGATLPALAVSDDFVHLVFIDSNGTILKYFRSDVSPAPTLHSWNSPSGGSISKPGTYNDIGNPAIAALNNQVYITFDSVRNTQPNQYGLLGFQSQISSGDEGGAWNPAAQNITSNDTYGTTAGNDKLSKSRSTSDAVPIDEAGLRPSVAISGTNFAVASQRRPDSVCQTDPDGNVIQNGTSEINVASAPTTWTIQEVLGNSATSYAIDPDIVVDSNGRHLVFLKAINLSIAQCHLGGDSLDYAVYYRGPLTEVQLPKVHLPMIRK